MHRVPGSHEPRLIRVDRLFRFLQNGQVPKNSISDEDKTELIWDLVATFFVRTLIVAKDEALVENLKRAMPSENAFLVRVVASAFAAGLEAADFQPDAVVVDSLIGQAETISFCQTLLTKFSQKQLVIALLSMDDTSLMARYPGNCLVFSKPVDVKLITEQLRDFVGAFKELD
jgi:PleD family two-component response regulator